MKVTVDKKIHKIKTCLLMNIRLSIINYSKKVKKISNPYKKNCKIVFWGVERMEVTVGILTFDRLERLFWLIDNDQKKLYPKGWHLFFKQTRCCVRYDEVHGLIVVVPGRLTRRQIILFYYYLTSKWGK